jgi:predicted nucleic acid-binding protein
LKSKGKPVPENDIWIAASAIQHGLLLFATDIHFTFIDGLTLVS